MKKILLSAIVGFASYTGAFASNEVVKDTFNLAQNERENSIDFDALDKVENDNNCFNYFNVSRGGVTTLVRLDSHASSSEDCYSQGKAHANIYREAGFEVGPIITITT